MIGLAAAWAIVLLSRNDFGPTWTRWAVGVIAAIGVLGVVVGGVLRWKKVVATAAIVGALAGFSASAAFGIATAATEHTGSIPTAVSTSQASGMGGSRRRDARGPGRIAQGGTPPSAHRPSRARRNRVRGSRGRRSVSRRGRWHGHGWRETSSQPPRC